MVEGPGCTRNAIKAREVVGKVVVATNHFSSKSSSGDPGLVGRRLDEVYTVGKELFLLFGVRNNYTHREDDNHDDVKEIALRLHFGMNGCLYLRKEGTASKIPSWRRKETLSLLITLVNEVENNKTTANVGSVIEATGCTANFVSAYVARSKLSRLSHLDVCGTAASFEPVAVMEALKTRPDAMICDAVLDQNRFPGVGNIIKIEGLHLARVHPRRRVLSLSDQELMSCIHHCRRYAMQWLSSGRAPTKMVYNKTTCGSCQRRGFIRMMKMGNCLSRTTFWCESCQPENKNMIAHSFRDQTRRELEKVNNASHNESASTADTRGAPVVEVDRKEIVPVHGCPQHGPGTLLLKRVRKTDSSNRNRLFRSCKIRGCQYFSWADSHLPLCLCRKRSILRVSKTERTGGRWFVSCANSGQSVVKTTKKCRLFSWAQPEHLAPLGESLTPLL